MLDSYLERRACGDGRSHLRAHLEHGTRENPGYEYVPTYTRPGNPLHPLLTSCMYTTSTTSPSGYVLSPSPSSSSYIPHT